ncbi:hypothetical protein [Komagataeibacter europaeus]|uniref:hypothetical protein n=1 Tax=Komagataeibacter europaeus TaxID=33995 RepID=UPI000237E08C|nr:hypothetical protein [Komagataeibacter europaeus]
MANDEDFRLFLLRERVRHAEAEYKYVEESLNRTKSRATYLLGWSITLASASVAAAMGTHHERRVEATIAATGFTLTAMLCAKVLYSTRTVALFQSPVRFDTILQDEDERSEAGYLDAYAELAEEVSVHNDQTVSKDQSTMRNAWVTACLTPAVTLLSVMFFAVWRRRAALHEVWAAIMHHS